MPRVLRGWCLSCGLAFGALLACGQDGATGPAGSTGNAGSNGSPGVSGVPGATGSMGSMGTPGGMGSAGSRGADGEAGAPGPSGPHGDAGSPGPTGDAGAPGPIGPRGGGVIWRDATGAAISLIATNGFFNGGGTSSIVDGRGYVWQATALGAPALPASVSALELSVYYASNDCTGPGFVNLFAARFVFRVASDAEYHVLPDNALVTLVATGSTRTATGGPCGAGAGNQYVAPLAGSVPSPAIVAPASFFTPPLHPEFVP